MKNFFRSVSTKLALKWSAILVVGILCLSIVFTILLNSFIKREQRQDLLSAIETISAEIKTVQPQQVDRIFPDVPYFITWSVFGDQEQAIWTNDQFLPRLPDTGGKTRHYLAKDLFIDGDMNILYMSSIVEIEENQSLLVVVALNMDTDKSSKIFTGLPEAIAFTIIPIILISFLISLLIARSTMKPVVKMTESAKKISITNLSSKLHVTEKRDELDELATTFNGLFEKLQKDYQREKNFTSDVSHELKTPVAVILGQANLLRRWGKNDPVQLEKSIDILIKEAKSMESIINNLLQLSRLENGKIKARIQPVDVLPLFIRLKEEVRTLGDDAQLDFENPKLMVLETDEELLHQVLMAVISNSIKFKGRGCRIKIHTVAENRKFSIFVEDNGTGFQKGTEDLVFGRFFRGDESHTRKVGGSGLGLSIAKAIVESLGGEISAYNSPVSGGAVIKIMLPS